MAPVSILIKTLTGRVTTMSVDTTITVAKFKELIVEKEGIEVEKQRLVFATKELNDEATLEDYDIRQGSTVHIAIRLGGGEKGI